MDGEQSQGHTWPLGMDNVQVQCVDGLQLPAATLSDEQLQQLTQAGYTFTVYNDSGSQALQQNSEDPQAELEANQVAEYESAIHSIQDSLHHLQALQSKEVTWQPKVKKEETDVISKAEPGINPAVMTGITPTQGQSAVLAGVITNVEGLRQEVPITFNIDGKAYGLSDLGDYRVLKLLTSEGHREATDSVPTPLQQGDSSLQKGVVLAQQSIAAQTSASLPQNNASVQPHSASLQENLLFPVAVTNFQPQQERYTAPNGVVLTSEFSENVGASTSEFTQNASEGTSEGIALPQTQDLFASAAEELTQGHVVPADDACGTDDGRDEGSVSVIEHVEPSRKSKRLAKMEADSLTEPARFSPQNQVYDVNELWCEECKRTFSGGCGTHKVQSVYDKVVLSRAWASLPPQLAIFRLADKPDSDLGVFAKKHLTKNVQFGPFVAEVVRDKSELPSSDFILKLESGDTERYLKRVDEDKCNWMMFVRPAENYEQQNMVAYQYGDDIFFTTVKDILPKDELKVWFAAHYAHRMNARVHPIPDNLSQEKTRKEKFECYLCEKSFKTAALLQKHLNDQDCTETGDTAGVRGHREGHEATSDNGQDSSYRQEEGSFQSWKKKKRNMYFNKIKKYKEISKRAEQKREQRDRSTNDCSANGSDVISASLFSCKQCNLTFDSASLLNIHTLTHAAGLDKLNSDQGSRDTGSSEMAAFDSLKALQSSETDKPADEKVHDKLSVKCPNCEKRFASPGLLRAHSVVHAGPRPRRLRRVVLKRQLDPLRPYPCNLCSKSFASSERLTRHQLSHSQDDTQRPLVCEICSKKFVNNSGLACHMKTHSQDKYYTCPMCRQGFDQMAELKRHSQQHLVNGLYPCPDCHKSFHDLASIKKHTRMSHPYQRLPCPVCHKIFPRADKLRLHMLCHSDHKAFMCETCGRQFKRKDKMKEHAKRVHNPAQPRVVRRCVMTPRDGDAKMKFVPKVAPTEFHRFIYKCHQCLLGFKRRGMLVNHLAKRHPAVKPDTIPELNLPILRTQRDFFCQYCDKVYKSSSKRKAHILKIHPGAPLPPNQRTSGRYNDSSETFSQCVGSVTTNPIHCEFCHKQYASRAKMMQHQRRDHPTLVPHKRSRRTILMSTEQTHQPSVLGERILEFPDGSAVVTTVQPSTNQEAPDIQHADLLTQAMSELTQNFDYRSHQTEFQITLPSLNNLQAAGVQSGDPDRQQDTSSIVVTPADGQATLDLSVLGQALMQGGFTATLVTDQSVGHSNPQVLTDQPVAATDEHDLNEEVVTDTENLVVQNMAQTQTITVPLSLASQLITKTWNQASEGHALK